jgi:hypothetical protein
MVRAEFTGEREICKLKERQKRKTRAVAGARELGFRLD